MHPEVNQYLYEVIREVYNNYDVDGIHFDYIRYQSDLYGYHREGLLEFEKIYEVNPRDIVRGVISPRFGWKKSYVDSLNLGWSKFKSSKITELLYLIRNDLIEFTRTYYPDTFNDFSEGSPGMMFMEMAAYVGDVLSYYTDTQLQETFLDTAQEKSNLYHLAYTLGYRPKVTAASATDLDVFQLIPSMLEGT